MKVIKNINQVCSALIMFAFCLQMFAFNLNAQKLRTNQTQKENKSIENHAKKKISPELEVKTNELISGLREDKRQKVIIRLKSETRLNEMFGNNLSEAGQKMLFDEEIRSNKVKRGILSSDLAQKNGRLDKSFDRLGLVSAELPLSKVAELSTNENIEYISPDSPISSSGYHVAETSGADDASSEISGREIHGDGIGVAVLDSGIDMTHELMQPYPSYLSSDGVTVYPANPGVVYSKDFTGQGTTTDNFGHGTHVATMLHGNKKKLSGDYRGTAWASKLLNLRVLDNDGLGTVSNVIAAIDWVIANKSQYNIRVINMSLGTIAQDSYRNDPLCLASRRAFNAGIVVVAAAGNDGKDANGNKIYGGIHSPGIEPTVLTVGAVNTFGTDWRSDDRVTSFSSRGPTRGYQTIRGKQVYDNLIKPDLVAPGNKLIGAASVASQTKSGSLYNKYPQLKTGNYTGDEQLMYMSGTSMATPVVAGIAAQLIEANPNLTPNLVKAILMFSAQQIYGANTLEQGAGIVNGEGAIEIVEVLKPSFSGLSKGSSLLQSSFPTPTNTIAGETVYWGKGIVGSYAILYGDNLMKKWQSIYANGVVLSDGVIVSDGVVLADGVVLSDGVVVSDGVIVSDGVLASDGYLFINGVVLSDGSAMGQGVVLSDGVVVSDHTPRATNTILGDNTSAMQAE